MPKPAEPKPTCKPTPVPPEQPAKAPASVREPSPYRLDWAAALKRVFGTEIFDCPRCGGRLTIVAFIEKASAVNAILHHLGLPSVPLPLAKARGPPQLALAW